MRTKSTKKAIKAIDRYFNKVTYYENAIKLKDRPLEDQPEFVKQHSVDYYKGLIAGATAAVEEQLWAEDCYYGFGYVDTKWNPINWYGIYDSVVDHPEFEENRRSYTIK